MAKIIAAAPPVPGEVIPIVRIARSLAVRGHQVTMLTGSGFRAMADEAGLPFARLGGAADYDIQEMATRPERAELPPAHRRSTSTGSTPSSTPCPMSTPPCRNCSTKTRTST